jgi:type IV secretion system protein VirB2
MNNANLQDVFERTHAAALTYMLTNERQIRIFFMIFIGLAMLLASPFALAQEAMPWEDAICKVATSLSGPTAKAIAVIAVVVCGLLLAFGEMNGIFKTFLGLLMGVSMALAAVQWTNAFGGAEFCG